MYGVLRCGVTGESVQASRWHTGAGAGKDHRQRAHGLVRLAAQPQDIAQRYVWSCCPHVRNALTFSAVKDLGLKHKILHRDMHGLAPSATNGIWRGLDSGMDACLPVYLARSFVRVRGADFICAHPGALQTRLCEASVSRIKYVSL